MSRWIRFAVSGLLLIATVPLALPLASQQVTSSATNASASSGTSPTSTGLPRGAETGPAPHAPAVIPTTLHEAQQQFDPENDPNILIGKDPTGPGYVGLHVQTAVPVPPDVKTPEQFRDWVKTRLP
jgi:hypothetical protein